MKPEQGDTCARAAGKRGRRCSSVWQNSENSSAVVWQGRPECDETRELWVAAGGNRQVLCGVKVVDTTTKGMCLCSAANGV